VFTFVAADFPIGIVIILLHPNNSAEICSIQHCTRRLGWRLKHFIGNEDWLSSAMHVHGLSQCGLLDSSVNSDSSAGWP